MGFCWSCLRVSSYILVALVAVLFFFHLECQKEREAAEIEKKSVKTDFRPDQTDVSNYQMNFAPPGVLSQDNHISLLMTLVPCPLKKLVLFVFFGDFRA